MTKTDPPDPEPAIRSSRRKRPEVLVDISTPFDAWGGLAFDAPEIAHRTVREALACADLPPVLQGRALEVSLLLANDDLVRTLNRTYRGKDCATNVLSFPLLSPDDPIPPEGPVPLGDIVLSFETLQRESETLLSRFQDHMTHLVAHGTLHLLGYDHEDESDADVMEELEVAILGRLGLKNPYT